MLKKQPIRFKKKNTDALMHQSISSGDICCLLGWEKKKWRGGWFGLGVERRKNASDFCFSLICLI